MRRGRAFVIGAGLAGLRAALSLSAAGVTVELCEATGQAGGRCRSYFDAQLGLTIDNGNHLVLSGNHAVMRYLRDIGAEERLAGPERAELDFMDMRSGARWRLQPNEGPLPWWILDPRRRAPGTSVAEHLGLAALLRAHPGRRVDQVMACGGPLWERLMEPFLLAALNTEPRSGDADLAGAVVRETLARGGRAYRPRIAHPSLAAAFVAPALETLQRRAHARLRLNRRLRGIGFDDGVIARLDFGDEAVTLGPGDVVVLAVPPWIAQELVPGLTVPDAFEAIVNGHFRVVPPTAAAPITGVIGGTAEWVFAFPDRVSTTISAAGAAADLDREVITARLWADICMVLGLSGEAPASRIVKERRATFAATPEQEAKRPRARTAWRNLFLAGDWTATGLPATIEGALRSGETAATLALKAEFAH